MAKKPSKQMWKRGLAVLLITVLVGFGADLASLVRIQIVQAQKYQEKAEAQQLSDTKISAQRGTIYDTNMKALAESATVWTVYIVPSKIKTDTQKSKIENDLAALLGVDKEDMVKYVGMKNSYTIVKKKIENPLKQKVTQFITDNSKIGMANLVGLTQDTKRYYPYNNFASTVIGFTGSDDQGLTGIEAYYDKYLTGTPGRVITAKNALQDAMPNSYETTVDAKQGDSIVLTIDEVMQYSLEKNLEQILRDTKAKNAYGIVMQVKTGAILAMATKPDFDLNHPWTVYDKTTADSIAKLPTEDQRKTATSAAISKQWRNKIISDTYEPGSVFKIVTASAGLEEKVVTPESRFFCKGYVMVAGRRINCHRHEGHGAENFIQGIVNSCNPVFIEVGQRLGVDKFCEYFDAFGLSQKTGVDLPGEADSIYYSKDKMGISELSSASFGQTVSITPIQMMCAINTVANGGKLMKPYLVRSIIDGNGNAVYTAVPTVKRQVISADTSKTLSALLAEVVKVGTGKNGYVAGYRVAGKTGTAEKVGNRNADGSKKYVSSFAAFAPYDDPEVSVLIIVDEPVGQNSGGVIAAPAAAVMIEDAMQYLNVQPHYTNDELAKLDVKTPDLVGKAVDAAKLTINGKFTAKVIGNGKTVLYQSPAIGHSIPSGGVIILYTDDKQSKRTAVVPDFSNMTVTQANKAAANAGINIKLSGNSLDEALTTACRQSIDAKTKVDLGTVVTVTFRHNDKPGEVVD